MKAQQQRTAGLTTRELNAAELQQVSGGATASSTTTIKSYQSVTMSINFLYGTGTAEAPRVSGGPRPPSGTGY